MYAVNIVDLCNTPAGKDFGVAILLNPVLDREHPIQTEKDRFDGMSAMLNCPEERAQAIVELLRKNTSGIYHSQTGKGG